MALREGIPIYSVSMIASTKCQGCSGTIQPGESAVFYNDPYLGGHYHNQGEIESAIDVWEESKSSLDEEIEWDIQDPVLRRVKTNLGIN